MKPRPSQPTRFAATMILLSLLGLYPAVALAGPDGETASLQADQTLEDLARELYDDPGAAEEIRVINGLEPGVQPPAGQPVKLPGEARQPAISALGVAVQSVDQARATGAADYAPQHFAKASAVLEKARKSCSRADYSRCQNLADETWALARMARKEAREQRSRKNRFAVSVDDKGNTRVEVMEGDGVAVEAKKQRTTVRRNQAVLVEAGQAPQKPQELPPPPEALLPFPDSRLVTAAIQFAWKPAAEVSRYVLLIARDAGGHRPVRQITTAGTSYLFRAKLEDGNYFWFLRSVNQKGLVGRASPARAFRLQVEKEGDISVEKAGDQSGAGGGKP